MINRNTAVRVGLISIVLAVLFTFAILSLLRSWSEQRGNLNLKCHAQMYVAAEPGVKQLELEVNIRDGQVLLLYGMNHEGKTREQLQLKGALTHWEPASLTYHMALDQGQLLVDVTQAELSTHLQQVMLAGRAPLLRGEAIILSFQLLEKLADRALLGFPDSSALWNCDVKKSGGL